VLVLPYGPGYSYASLDEVKAAAQQAAEDYIHLAGLSADAKTKIEVIDVDLTNAGPGGTTVRRVGVKITHQFDTLLPVFLLSGSSPIQMGVTSVMEHE
jgi:hypothetical protein